MSECYQPSQKQAIIADYLRKKVNMGSRYFKSSSIAKDIGMSSKEVGTNLGRLSREVEDLHIEKWAQASKATTWRIEPAE